MSLSDIQKRRAFLKSATVLAGLATLGGCSEFKNVFRERDYVPAYPRNRKRVTVLSTGAGLEVDKSLTAQVSLPAPQIVTRHLQNEGRPDHCAVNAKVSTLQLTRENCETYSIGSGNDPFAPLSWIAIFPNDRGALQTPPVIGNGMIYTVDSHGDVRAAKWPSMERVWHYQPAAEMHSSNLGGGLALGGDTLYGVDGVSTAWAADAATGKIKWRIDIGTPGRSAPLLAEGVLYFSTIDDKLFAVNAKTGEQVWAYRTQKADTVLFGAATPAYRDGVILAAFGNGELTALRAGSGEVIWSDSLGGANGRGAVLDFACVRGSPVISDDTAYAISLSQVLVAIDMKSGRRLWEREVSGQNPICVCGDWMYVLSLDQQIACMDKKTGQVKWLADLPRFTRPKKQKGFIVWTGLLLANGKLICVSSDKKQSIAVIDARNGKIEAIYPALSPSTVLPISCDERILILSNDGNLHIYK